MNKIIITNIYFKEIFSHRRFNNSIKKTLEISVNKGANLWKADLRGANLWEADLGGASLWEADLKEANLRGANLRGASLRRANLSGTNLKEANLRGANLKEANLRGASLWEADLKEADLRGADLSGTNLSGTNLRGTNLRGAKINNIYRTNLNILKSQKNNLIVYKYLNNNLTSPYQNFKYRIGKEYTSINANENNKILCGKGINIATLEWCLQNTNNNINDYIYIECEINPHDLIIPFNSDGKFRIKSGGKIKLNKILTKIEIDEIINN